MTKKAYLIPAFVLLVALFVLFVSISATTYLGPDSYLQNDLYLPLITNPPGPCDVPTDLHPTIQSAVDDDGCTSIVLIAAHYFERTNIGRSVTIQGQGANYTTVDGIGGGSVFTVQTGVESALNDMTITNGSADYGGGIHNEGKLQVTNSTVSGNSAHGPSEGGGIYNTGILILIDSTVSSNEAYDGAGLVNEGTAHVTNSVLTDNSANQGGAIFNHNKLSVTGSTLHGNSSENRGGGILNSGHLTVTNSTLSDNVVTTPDPDVTNGGGGIFGTTCTIQLTNTTLSGNSAIKGGGIFAFAYCTISVTNSTLSNNLGVSQGGGIFIFSEVVDLYTTNSIIANSTSGGDCSGEPIISQGHNIASDNTCDLDGPGDMNNTNPRLSPLQNNGGPTHTHALRSASPAIDEGTNASCPSTDQRGFPRPIDGDGDGTAVCDIGAVERQ